MTTSPNDTSPPRQPGTTVVVVGIVGLSASGKSTAAHLLARLLRSPLLPISLDDYFLPSACEALGTYEDYRAIDFTLFTEDLRHAKAILAREISAPCALKAHGREGPTLLPEEVERDWRATLREAVPRLARYVMPIAPRFAVDDAASARAAAEDDSPRSPAMALPADRSTVCAAPLASSSSSPANEASDAGALCPTASDGRRPPDTNDDDDKDDDDASLRAHEEEEERMRTQTLARWAGAPSVSQTPGTVSVPGSAPAAARPCIPSHSSHEMVFLVCEGFNLFCDARMTDQHIVDVCVTVNCDPIVACQRRFCRTPRRHRVGAANYKQRIEQLWDSRTETRRRELLAVLTEQLGGADRGGWRELLEEDAGSLFLLRPPPSVPAAADLGAALWGPASGPATGALEAHPGSLAGGAGATHSPYTTPAARESLPARGGVAATASGRAGPQTDASFHAAHAYRAALARAGAVAASRRGGTGVAAQLGLTQKKSNEGDRCPSGCLPEEKEEEFAWRKYCEFSYWYFHEVLYHYDLFWPLQLSRIRTAFAAETPPFGGESAAACHSQDSPEGVPMCPRTLPEATEEEKPASLHECGASEDRAAAARAFTPRAASPHTGLLARLVNETDAHQGDLARQVAQLADNIKRWARERYR